MFGDGEGLELEIKFAVEATYEKFANRWGMVSEKLHWVDIWAPFLASFTVDEINTVADHCVKDFRRPPVPAEFIELANRARRGQLLSEPIVSKVERMAYLILISEEFSSTDATNSEISDACLIAAAIAHSQSYAEVLPNANPDHIVSEFTGRAGMFASESVHWKKDAEEGKGYWAKLFASKNGE